METSTAILIIGALLIAAVVVFMLMQSRQPAQPQLGAGAMIGAGIGSLVEGIVVAATGDGGGSSQQQRAT